MDNFKLRFNRNAIKTLDALNISEPRARKIRNFLEFMVPRTNHLTDGLDAIAGFAETPEEFAYMTMIWGSYFSQVQLHNITVERILSTLN